MFLSRSLIAVIGLVALSMCPSLHALKGKPTACQRQLVERFRAASFEPLAKFQWNSETPQVTSIDLSTYLPDGAQILDIHKRLGPLLEDSSLRFHWSRGAVLDPKYFPGGFQPDHSYEKSPQIYETLRPVIEMVRKMDRAMRTKIRNPRPLRQIYIFYEDGRKPRYIVDSPHRHRFESYGANLELLPGAKGILLCDSQEKSSEHKTAAEAHTLTVFNSLQWHMSVPQRKRLAVVLSYGP